jgi:HEAT repeat protein
MSNTTHYGAVAKRLLLSLALCTSYATAAELAFPRDGWTSWEVPAVPDAPAWCCFGEMRKGGPMNAQPCQLDEKQNGYGNQDGETTDTIRVYAHFTKGELDRLRAYAASCPVQTNGVTIESLGNVSDEASARWLGTLLAQDDKDRPLTRRLRNDVTAALAVHRSHVAHDALTLIARNDKHLEARKEAVFWIAHVRGEDGARVATSIMFDDANARMREHATFAVSQSKSPRIASDLIRLAGTDRDTRVRSQAWFWLGQKGFPEAESAINTALTKEQDQRVREQAVFALSQLPDERATPALIAVAENAALSRGDRKQAIFWLAQEGSDSALQYLDRIVTATAR